MGPKPSTDPTFPEPLPETEAKRQARVTRESEMLAEARAELDAGLGVSGPALEEWLTAFANGEERPIPAPASPKPR
jgi:hypothetical protein